MLSFRPSAGLLAAACLLACVETDAPARTAEGEVIVDADPSGVLVGERTRDLLPESDAPPVYRIERRDAPDTTGRIVADAARTAVLSGETTWVVDDGGVLWTVVDGERHRRTDGIIGRPAMLEDGAAVVAREGDAPLESTLWIVPAGAGAPRPLTIGAGPDDTPIALPDGRVAFVSGRTTVASLWVVDPATGDETQLTNRGLVVGGTRDGFVPTPVRAESARVTDGALVFDAGGGVWWTLDLETKDARRLATPAADPPGDEAVP